LQSEKHKEGILDREKEEALADFNTWSRETIFEVSIAI
jgi:hypothetical protein